MANVFGTRIRNRRQVLKMSMNDIAKTMGGGVSMSSVYAWEKGLNLPYERKLHALATALGWTVDELVVGTELNGVVLRGGSAQPEESVGIENSKPQVVRIPGTASVYLLCNGRVNHKDAPGSQADWHAVVMAIAEESAVYVAWADALLDTTNRFRVDTEAALKLLQERNPGWSVSRDLPREIAPDLD